MGKVLHELQSGSVRALETQVLSQPELRFVSGRTQRLIQSALPEMQHLHRLVDPLDFTVMLADPTGIVLSRHTQRSQLSGCRRWRFQAGAVWDEQNAGTNAIGTCLREERPVMVVHDQHWRLCFRKLTGMAVPVYNSIGELAGAMDISSFTAENVVPAAPLLMDALLTTARRVEEKLFHDRFGQDMIVTLGPSTSSSSMLVALDRDGHVRGDPCQPTAHELARGRTVQPSGPATPARCAGRGEFPQG